MPFCTVNNNIAIIIGTEERETNSVLVQLFDPLSMIIGASQEQDQKECASDVMVGRVWAMRRIYIEE